KNRCSRLQCDSHVCMHAPRLWFFVLHKQAFSLPLHSHLGCAHCNGPHVRFWVEIPYRLQGHPFSKGLNSAWVGGSPQIICNLPAAARVYPFTNIGCWPIDPIQCFAGGRSHSRILQFPRRSLKKLIRLTIHSAAPKMKL